MTGDRVQCDWLQNGRPDTGTVVPFTRTDLDQSGRWYRVRLDKEKIPNATVECMADRLRAAPAASAPAPASGSIGAVGRSYRVAGSTLTTVNRDDGRVQDWRMSGSDGVIEIREPRQSLKLHYNGTTQCR